MRSSRTGRRGAALIIVLAFVVLLTGIVLAYFTRTTTDRQVAHGSFNQTKADQLALSAADLVITDLKQEVVNGSTTSTVNGKTIYTPNPSANMIPMRSGTPGPGATPVPNLLRRSVQADSLPPPGVKSRASAVSSTTTSANGRAVDTTRWNRHYFVPKLNPLTDDSIPVSSFIAPDWVFVTTNGPAILTVPSSSTIGRYAYAIYDEGGLVDINVAGYPSATTLYQFGPKGSIAFADLTTAPSTNPSSSTNLPPAQVDNIVGWRNYATANATGTFPNLVSNAATYFTFILSNTTGFLKTSGAAPWNGRTDQVFLSRQELIKFQSSTQLTANALQYLTHFSRETDANVPQWSPAVPNTSNPNFQTLRVTSGFTRSDGTPAIVGDPLVKKRFLLQRLNWLTYRGASASRTLTDPDMAILTGRYNVLSTFLQLGTAANIQKYFGLVWNTSNERWDYVGSSGAALQSSISTPLTGTREPNFFELLQAGITSGSLGVSAASDPALPVAHQQSAMLHVLSIGANLIAQSRPDSYPVRIACNVNVGGTNTTMEATGVPRLPFLNSLAACPVAGTGTTGGINWFLVPNIWNPFRDTWDMTEANVSSTLTPAYPRPTIRITIGGSGGTGTIGFGSIVSSSLVQTGAIPSPSATPFAATVAVPSTSLTFVTGTTVGNAFGRDGHTEASRLSTSDFTSTPASYTTSTSPAGSSATAGWSSISKPPRPDNSTEGTTNIIAFRVSLPGSAIPASTTTVTTNPVLILKPGFQITLDYQSPNGIWYPYSFLQGNNATNTWISASNSANPSLNLATTASQYGFNPAPTPAPPATQRTVLKLGAAAPWDMVTLAQAPMFAKGDPRSIRYNSDIGVVNLASPPMSVVSAGAIGPIWPDTYATPPPMTKTGFPGPTPSPNPNPAATYIPVSDNGVAGSNPYNENTSGTGNAVRPVMMNRPYRSVGEMGYAFRDQPFKTLDFSLSTSPDAALLDLFSVNEYNDASGMRAGVINLNGRQPGATAAILKNTIRREDIPRVSAVPTPAPAPSPITDTPAYDIATSLASLTSTTPVVNRAGLTGLIASETGLGPTVQKTQREAIARALGEVDQTRTWNLMIDVIAQSGRYPPTATSAADLPKFVVEGEQRYWVHVAIDRFTGEVIDRQVEVVKE